MTIDDPLPAPESMDTPTTRPKLDLPNVIAQIVSIQITLELERKRREECRNGSKK